MAQKWSLCCATFILLVSNLALANYGSVDPSDVDAYLKECGGPKTVNEMRHEIPDLLKILSSSEAVSNDSSIGGKTWRNRFVSVFRRNSSQLRNRVLLDGLELRLISPADLYAIAVLTTDRDASMPIWRERFPIVRTEIIEGDTVTLKVNRYCKDLGCRSRSQPAIDLSMYNNPAPCSDAVCVAERIFGKDAGIQILWSFLRYGHNLSRFNSPEADPDGLSSDSLSAIVIAQMMTPPSLFKQLFANKRFYRSSKGGRTDIIANADGGVFDPIDKLNLAEQISLFIHETGHRAEPRVGSQSAYEWFLASGWQITNRSLENNSEDGWVSDYARTNHAEDFAETYSLYRMNPKKLKRLSVKRYEYMKKYVFEGLEYTGNLCKGSYLESDRGFRR